MSDFHQIVNSISDSVLNTVNYKGAFHESHIHKSFELLYAKRGTSYITVDGREYELSEGNFALVLPYCVHSFCTAENAELFITVFSRSYAEELFELTAGKSADICAFSVPSYVREYFDREVVDGYGESFEPPCKSDAIILKSAICAVCHKFLCAATLCDKGEENELCRRLIEITATRSHEGITLGDLSAELGYSYQYLSKIFKEKIGISFKELLNSYRVERAKSLLVHSDMPVTDIAMESGFGSTRNFNFRFLSSVGVSPLEFRKRNK